jgi:hemolysin activation/secretion protein
MLLQFSRTPRLVRAKYSRVLFLLMTTLGPARAQSLPFFPNVTPNASIEQREEQRQDAAKQRAMARPDVLSAAAGGPTTGPLLLPDESPCFPIKSVVWDGSQQFGWLNT